MKRYSRIPILLFLSMLGTAAMAKSTELPQFSIAGGGKTYYLIRSVSADKYAKSFATKSSGDNRITFYPYTQTGDHAMDDAFLFYFVQDGTGYKIGAKNSSEKYLTNDTYGVSGNLHEFTTGGTIWYLTTHPSGKGFGVSHDSSFPTSGTGKKTSWKMDTSGYDCIALDHYDSSKETFCWEFISHADLVAEAKALIASTQRRYKATADLEAVVNTATDPASGADFKKLLVGIAAYKAWAATFAEIVDGIYAVQCPDNNLYLTYCRNVDDASGFDYNGSKNLSEDAIWTVTANYNPSGGYYEDTYSISNVFNPELTFTVAGDPAILISKTSTDGVYTIKNSDGSKTQGIIKSTDTSTDYGTTTGNPGSKHSTNWKFVPYSTDLWKAGTENDGILFSNDESLGKGRYFRILNYADNRKGYVEDVDHEIHDHADDKQMGTRNGTFLVDATYSSTASPKVDMWMLKQDKSHISSIWEFELALAAAGDNKDDHATGVVTGEHKHNVYRIRNVNTNKYIGEPESGNSYLPLVAEKKNAAGFWLEWIRDAQYRIVLRDNTQNNDNPKGYVYLDNAFGDKNQYGTANYKSGGIAWTSDEKFFFSKQSLFDSYKLITGWGNTPGAFYLTEATDIEVEMNNAIPTGDNEEIPYSWSTTYLPFNATLGPGCYGTKEKNYNDRVRIYTGHWESTYMKMEEVSDIPALHGVLLVGPKNDDIASGETFGGHVFRGENGDRITLLINKEDASTPENAFAESHLYGVVEGEGTAFKRNDKDYYAFGAYKVAAESGDYKETKMVAAHPWGPYLFANKAYMKTADRQSATGENSSAARYFVSFDTLDGDPQIVNGIEEIDDSPIDDLPIYDLSGRKIVNQKSVNRKLPSGLYIRGGKKYIIR